MNGWGQIVANTHVLWQASPRWRFDLLSALIGVVLTLILLWLMRTFRPTLEAASRSFLSRLQQWQGQFQADLETRYLQQVARYVQHLILPVCDIPLERRFIAPDLRVPAPPPRSLSDLENLEELESAFPPYRDIPLRQALNGYPRLAVTPPLTAIRNGERGPIGSGQTTLMAYIALMCSQQLTAAGDTADAAPSPPLLDPARVPLYLSLTAIEWGTGTEAETTPPTTLSSVDLELEPENDDDNDGNGGNDTAETTPDRAAPLPTLIDATLRTVGGRRSMRTILQKRLEEGQAIVLADGWDEIPPSCRAQAAEWLIAAAEAAPNNVWLVAVGSEGSAPFIEAGFVPVEIVPWSDEHVLAFARRWADIAAAAGRSELTTPAGFDAFVARLRQTARQGTPPLELAYRAFLQATGAAVNVPIERRTPLYAALLDSWLAQPQEKGKRKNPLPSWWMTACRAILGELSLTLQRERRTLITPEELDAVITEVLAGISSTQDVDTPETPNQTKEPTKGTELAEIAQAIEATEPTETATDAVSPGVDRQLVARIRHTLTAEQNLMRTVSTSDSDKDRRYAFSHPLWSAYLAACRLAETEQNPPPESLEAPQWIETVAFLAEMGDIGPTVTAWLRTPDDLFFSRLCTLGRWVQAAPTSVPWRNSTLALLGRAFIQLPAPPPVRRALGQALARTRAAGISHLFKQALRHSDPHIRTAALLGLSYVAGEADLPVFRAALSDPSPAVRHAAITGLATIGSDAALHELARVLLEGDQEISLAVGEALAHCGPDGVQVLHEATTMDDPLVRRAAVAGLARLQDRTALEEVIRTDPQWIVRVAAQTALDELEQREEHTVPAPIRLDELPWLIAWAASQGESVGVGESARRMLRRALREGDAITQAMVARTLAQAGRPDDVELLREALAAPPAPQVATAALEALSAIGARYAIRIERLTAS